MNHQLKLRQKNIHATEHEILILEWASWNLVFSLLIQGNFKISVNYSNWLCIVNVVSSRELSRFIAAGRLNCKIDKVGGVVETNRYLFVVQWIKIDLKMLKSLNMLLQKLWNICMWAKPKILWTHFHELHVEALFSQAIIIRIRFILFCFFLTGSHHDSSLIICTSIMSTSSTTNPSGFLLALQVSCQWELCLV